MTKPVDSSLTEDAVFVGIYLAVSYCALRRYGYRCYAIVMQAKARHQLAVYKGQALGLCWLLQQPLGSGGEVLAGLTRMLAFSRPLSGAEWSAFPPGDRERVASAFHARVLRLFRQGLAIRCLVVAKVTPTARGLQVERIRAVTAQDQGLLYLLEEASNRLRRCRHCGAWFWRERKREYCDPCFHSGTARSKVHRAKAKAAHAGAVRDPVSTSPDQDSGRGGPRRNRTLMTRVHSAEHRKRRNQA